MEKSLCEFVQSDKASVVDSIRRVSNAHDTLCSDDVKSSVVSLSAKRRVVLIICLQNIFYMLVLVYMFCFSICFNAFIVHGFLPSDLIDTVLVPIVKDKTGDISGK